MLAADFMYVDYFTSLAKTYLMRDQSKLYGFKYEMLICLFAYPTAQSFTFGKNKNRLFTMKFNRAIPLFQL